MHIARGLIVFPFILQAYFQAQLFIASLIDSFQKRKQPKAEELHDAVEFSLPLLFFISIEQG